MSQLVASFLAFPTVVLTVPLGVVLLYWLLVILGALDVDSFGGGHADGALEGVAKGAAEGAAKGVAEGVARGVAEDGLASLFGALKLTAAPVTVVGSLLVAFAWMFSVLATQLLQRVGAAGTPPGALWGTAVLIASLLLALPPTSLLVRPLGRLFVTHTARSRTDLVGKVCVVSTGRVDGSFGQATMEDGGAGLILPVRCDTPGVLARGDRALIIAWDEQREGFVVEPVRDFLAEPGARAADDGGAGRAG